MQNYVQIVMQNKPGRNFLQNYASFFMTIMQNSAESYARFSYFRGDIVAHVPPPLAGWMRIK